MKELIEKIDVCEPAVKEALQWLSESGNNGLNEAIQMMLFAFF